MGFKRVNTPVITEKGTPLIFAGYTYQIWSHDENKGKTVPHEISSEVVDVEESKLSKGERITITLNWIAKGKTGVIRVNTISSRTLDENGDKTTLSIALRKLGYEFDPHAGLDLPQESNPDSDFGALFDDTFEGQEEIPTEVINTFLEDKKGTKYYGKLYQKENSIYYQIDLESLVLVD